MLFAITDLRQLAVYLGRLFTGGVSGSEPYYFRNYFAVMLLGCLLSSGLGNRLYDRIRKRKGVTAVMLTGILILSVAFLADASYNPFLYFRF